LKAVQRRDGQRLKTMALICSVIRKARLAASFDSRSWRRSPVQKGRQRTNMMRTFIAGPARETAVRHFFERSK